MRTYSNLVTTLTTSLLILVTFAVQSPAPERYASAKDETDVSKVVKDWSDSITKSDTVALGKVLADNYSVVIANGANWSKSEELGSLKDDSLKVAAFSVGGTKVRVYVGGATVTGRVTVKGKYKAQDLDGDYNFVQILEPNKSGWQIVFLQYTKVSDK